MGLIKTLREASDRVDRIVREEVTDPREWEAELSDNQPQGGNQEGQK